jgi:hypothetical protein
MVVSYLKRCVSRWRLNHVISKFSNSIQHLLEISAHSLYRSPPDLVNNSKVLVMAYNIKEHSNLFFYAGMSAVPQQISRP